jgi:hypothetical protein
MFKLKNLFQKSFIPITGVMFFLVANASPIYGLDWDDKNWEAYGCPKNIIGSWVSRDKDDRLMIEAERLIFQTSDSGQKFYSYKQNFSVHEKRITEIILSSKNMDDENQVYLKIRPHIAQISLAESLQQDKTASCQIKVFQYENQKDAKLDKYMSWDIYKRK